MFFNEDELTVELEYSIDKIFKEEKCIFKKAVNTSVIASLVTLVCGKILSIVLLLRKTSHTRHRVCKCWPQGTCDRFRNVGEHSN